MRFIHSSHCVEISSSTIPYGSLDGPDMQSPGPAPPPGASRQAGRTPGAVCVSATVGQAAGAARSHVLSSQEAEAALLLGNTIFRRINRMRL